MPSFSCSASCSSGNPEACRYSFELDGDQPRRKEFPISAVSNEDWEDVAYTFGSDGRGRLWILESTGEPPPRRSTKCPRSYPTHKAAIIRLYLQGLTTPDIAARSYHSKEAVDRYIRGFERVRLLSGKFAREELPLLTGMSAGLVDQYLALIQEHGLAAPVTAKEVNLRASG